MLKSLSTQQETSTETTADAQGRFIAFVTVPPELGEYVVSAVTVGPGGHTSEAVTVKFVIREVRLPGE